MATTSSDKEITLRQRRQVTLPADVCEALGLETGDKLQVFLTEDGVMIRPKRDAALKALREIQAAFAASGVTEAALQAAGRGVRRRLSSER